MDGSFGIEAPRPPAPGPIIAKPDVLLPYDVELGIPPPPLRSWELDEYELPRSWCDDDVEERGGRAPAAEGLYVCVADGANAPASIRIFPT